MLSDDWVDIFYWVSPNNSSSSSRPGEISLLDTGMHCLERTQECDEWRGELFQRRDLRREQSVSTRLRLRQEEESRQSRRLELVRDICVPDCRGNAVIDLKVEARIGIPGNTMPPIRLARGLLNGE